MAHDDVPVQSQDHTVLAKEVLAERASRAGKLVGGISSGGLSIRPSRKGHEEVQSPVEEPRKHGASPLQTLGKDAEVSSDTDVVTSTDHTVHIQCRTGSDTRLNPLIALLHRTADLAGVLHACIPNVVSHQVVPAPTTFLPRWTRLMRCSLSATCMLCLSSGASHAPAPCSLSHDIQ